MDYRMTIDYLVFSSRTCEYKTLRKQVSEFPSIEAPKGYVIASVKIYYSTKKVDVYLSEVSK